jgi:excisionase family DNA binding protein
MEARVNYVDRATRVTPTAVCVALRARNGYLRIEHMTELLVSARELAGLYGVTEETVRVWARAGVIPALHVGPRLLRFDPEAVRASLESKDS